MNGENSHPKNLSDELTGAHKLSPPPHPPRQSKKQVRRRLHTSRPYQERLLNMAEARREIVAALKFHRAAMKQASEEQKQQNQQAHWTQPLSPPPQATGSILEESHFTLPMDSLKIPSNIYQTNLTGTSCTHQSSLFTPTSHSSPSWSYPQITTLPIFDDFSRLPLGLNLNLQSFTDIETPYISSTIDPHAHQPPPAPSPSPSPSSSSSSYSYTSPAGMSSGTPEASLLAEKLNPTDPLLHPAMGDEEMAEIRSISEKHDMEWSDTVNLAKSAWWSKFFKNMEMEGSENGEGEAFQVFSEVTDAQAWPSDGYLLDHNMDDHQQDVAPPR